MEDGRIESALFWYWNPGVGKVCSGRKKSCQEKNNVDAADGQQVVVPHLLVVSAVRLGERYCRRGTTLRFPRPTGTHNKYAGCRAQAIA